MIYSSYILIILLKSFWYLSYFLIYKKLDTLLYIKDNENKWKIAVFAISKLGFYDVIVVFFKEFFYISKNLYVIYIFFFFWALRTKPRCTFSLDRKSTQKDQAGCYTLDRYFIYTWPTSCLQPRRIAWTHSGLDHIYCFIIDKITISWRASGFVI